MQCIESALLAKLGLQIPVNQNAETRTRNAHSARKEGEALLIGDNIEVVVVAVDGQQVRLGD
jgi:hypothetical protein